MNDAKQTMLPVPESTFRAAKPAAPPKRNGKIVDDDELIAMYEMDGLLQGLDTPARVRVLRWLADRYAAYGVGPAQEARP